MVCARSDKGRDGVRLMYHELGSGWLLISDCRRDGVTDDGPNIVWLSVSWLTADSDFAES